MAPHQAVRLYHSTAILLPDARVLVAGGQDIDPALCSHPYFDAEVFSPPYLFKGQRPQITLAPSILNYNQPAQIHVLVREGQSVEDLVLVRPGAVTHHFNTEQRLLGLDFTVLAVSDQSCVSGPCPPPGHLLYLISVTGPTSAHAAPTGHYMLFALNQNGVPSVAKFLKVE